MFLVYAYVKERFAIDFVPSSVEQVTRSGIVSLADVFKIHQRR
jgi:hypothetical protein